MILTVTLVLSGAACFLLLTKGLQRCISFYKSQTRFYSYWESQNVKYVSATFPLGSFKISEMNLMKSETKYYRDFGRVYGRLDGSIPVLTVGERDMVKKIMLTDFHRFPNRRCMTLGDDLFDKTLFSLEGKDWKRVRDCVKTGFTHSNLKKMITLLQECCDDLTEKLAQKVEKEEVINCQQHFSVFVLHTIARCAFGVKINDNDPFISNANELFNEPWKTILIMCFPAFMKSFKLTLLNTKTTQFYNDVMSEVVEERRKIITDQKFNDFLQRMLDCEAKQDSNNNNEAASLTHTEMLSQCVSFFLAGYEATTSFLSHVLYRFAVDPECQKRVVEEMRRFAPKERDLNKDEVERNDETFTYLSKLKYLDAVMKECLRLCPSMVRIERRAEGDYIFKEEDIHLKHSFLISIPVFAMHHDPEYYPEPEVFNPDRFYETERKEYQNIFFPFGSGGRECVGKNFVKMQVKLCLVNLLMKFEVLPAPTTPAELKFIETRNVLKVDNVDVVLRRWSST